MILAIGIFCDKGSKHGSSFIPSLRERKEEKGEEEEEAGGRRGRRGRRGEKKEKMKRRGKMIGEEGQKGMTRVKERRGASPLNWDSGFLKLNG